MKFIAIEGGNFFALSLSISSFPDTANFKFISSSATWFDPEIDVSNKKYSNACSVNYSFDKMKTGRDLVALVPQELHVLVNICFLRIGDQRCSIDISPWLLTCNIDTELGQNGKAKNKFYVLIPHVYSAKVLVHESPDMVLRRNKLG
jgi:hypothetical protein